MQNPIYSISIKYLKQFQGLPKHCWRGIIYSLIESTLMGVIYFLPVYFVSQMRLSIPTSGALISVYGIGAMLGGFCFGKLSQSVPTKHLLLLTLTIQAFAFIGLSLCSYTPTLAFLLLMIGIASYGFITSNQTHILSYCEQPQQLKAINLLSTASNIGLAASAILLSLVQAQNYRAILASSAVLFALLALSILAQKNLKPLTQQISTQDNNKSAHSKQKQLMLTILACVFLIGAIVAQLGASYAIYIEKNIDTPGLHALGILFAINSLMVVLLETPLGNLCNNTNKMRMIGLASFLIGAGMFMLILSHRIEMAILACMIYTMGEILFFCMTQYACYQLADNQSKGMGVGMFRSVYAASRIAGPLLGGIIYHQASGELLWLCCGILGVFCMLICFKQAKPALI